MNVQTLIKTHPLNHSGSLEISYNTFNTKFTVTQIVLKKQNENKSFLLSETWINNQPAQHLKGIKAQIIENEFTFNAYIIEGKLHLFSDSFKEMQINVQYNGNNYTFPVSPNLKLKGLNAIVEHTLKHANFEIIDQETQKKLQGATLGECNIKETSILEINQKKIKKNDPLASSGFASAEFGEFNNSFVDFKEEISLDVEKEPPPWRVLENGLNLVGICFGHIFTVNCKAFAKKVYIPIGTGTFSIIDKVVDKGFCPACHQKIKNISNCIFQNCVYTVEGSTPTEKENQVIILKKQTPNKIVRSFSSLNHSVEWNSLTVTCSPVSKRAYYLIFAAAIVGILGAGIYKIKREKK